MRWSTQPAPGQSPTGDTAWQVLIRHRWSRLQKLITLQERSLDRAWLREDRASIEHSLWCLKRVALSIWIDAQTEGLELPAHPVSRHDSGHL